MGARRWLQPELLFWDGQVRAGLALEVDERGRVAGAGTPPAGAEVEALRGRLLLPGLVNAHSHAFQRLIRGRTEYVAAGQERDDFWSWRELMYRAAGALDPEGVYVASRQAFVEMALCGTTSVGEFHYLHHAPDGAPYADRLELSRQVIRAARDVGLRISLLRVGYARAGFRKPENPRQRRFIDPSLDLFLEDAVQLRQAMREDPAVAVGLAPHSVRAVPRAWLEQLPRAAPPGMPIHLHIAEQPAEIDACREEHGVTPVELLDGLGLLREGVTLVHAVHVTAGEVKRIGAAGATVCACPSTERNLGDGIVRADELLRAGAPVCLGTDSHAAVDLLDEARQLEGHLRLLRLRRAVMDPGGGDPDGPGGPPAEERHGARGVEPGAGGRGCAGAPAGGGPVRRGPGAPFAGRLHAGVGAAGAGAGRRAGRGAGRGGGREMDRPGRRARAPAGVGPRFRGAVEEGIRVTGFRVGVLA